MNAALEQMISVVADSTVPDWQFYTVGQTNTTLIHTSFIFSTGVHSGYVSVKTLTKGSW